MADISQVARLQINLLNSKDIVDEIILSQFIAGLIGYLLKPFETYHEKATALHFNVLNYFY